LQVPDTQEEDRFEDVNIDDPVKPAPPKKKGLFARMVDSVDHSAENGNANNSRPGSGSENKSAPWHAHLTGRKRGQSGQGAELGSIPKKETVKPESGLKVESHVQEETNAKAESPAAKFETSKKTESSLKPESALKPETQHKGAQQQQAQPQQTQQKPTIPTIELPAPAQTQTTTQTPAQAPKKENSQAPEIKVDS
jgi:hypothetical protein